MKMMRTYFSAYPFWYKLITLCLFPLGFLVSTTIFQAVDPDFEEMTVLWSFLNVYLALIEMETEFFSLGAIYRKAEPFGKLILTSNRGKGYFETFAKGDVLRRLLWCIALYELPLFVADLLRNTGVVKMSAEGSEAADAAVAAALEQTHYFLNSRYAQHLMIALALFTALQWSLYLTRRIESRVLLTLAVLIATVVCTLLPLLFMTEMPALFRMIYAVLILTAGAGAAAVSILSAKKAGRESYYDR